MANGTCEQAARDQAVSQLHPITEASIQHEIERDHRHS